MSKELMIGALPFKFRNVGALSSCGTNVKTAPPLVIEELFCMMNSVQAKVGFSRAIDQALVQSSEILAQHQKLRDLENRKRQERRQEAWESERFAGGGTGMSLTIFDHDAGEVEIRNLTSSADSPRSVTGACSSGRAGSSMKNGVCTSVLWIPRDMRNGRDYLAKQCFIDDIRDSLKLWEVIVWADRLRFNFCDCQEPGQDKHNTRAFVELQGKITLQAIVRAEPIANEPERRLFVRYGVDAADGWGDYVDVATGTDKDGLAQTRFYPKASMDCFAKIAESI